MTLVADFSEIQVGCADDSALPRPASDGLALIQAGLAKLLNADLDVHESQLALDLTSEIELMGRQVDAVRSQVFDSIDRTGVYADDGHRGAKPMIAHNAKLSGPEAMARQKTMKVLRGLPLVAAAFYSGEISTCMANRLGRTYANPRVRDLMVDADDWFRSHALNDTYEFFDTVVTEWERLADEDGAESRDARHDRARNHTMVQDADGQWSGGAPPPPTTVPSRKISSMRSNESSSTLIGNGQKTTTATAQTVCTCPAPLHSAVPMHLQKCMNTRLGHSKPKRATRSRPTW